MASIRDSNQFETLEIPLDPGSIPGQPSFLIVQWQYVRFSSLRRGSIPSKEFDSNQSQVLQLSWQSTVLITLRSWVQAPSRPWSITRPKIVAPLAQQAVRSTVNRKVVSSILTRSFVCSGVVSTVVFDTTVKVLLEKDLSKEVSLRRHHLGVFSGCSLVVE